MIDLLRTRLVKIWAFLTAKDRSDIDIVVARRETELERDRLQKELNELELKTIEETQREIEEKKRIIKEKLNN